MLKLYKQVGNLIHYWETWDKDNNTGVVHWGIAGETGQSKEIKSGFLKNFRNTIQKEIDLQLSEGYAPVEDDDLATLLIEYKIDDMGTPEDLEKRIRLQQKMDNDLGWTGLGHCDGGSTGSGTMEVCCLVIDFNIAKELIEEKLKNTEFSNFTRIYSDRA